MTTAIRPTSALRQRMLQDLQLAGVSEHHGRPTSARSGNSLTFSTPHPTGSARIKSAINFSTSRTTANSPLRRL